MKPLFTTRAACWFFDLLGVAGLVIILIGVEARFGLDIAMVILGAAMLAVAIACCRRQ